MLFRIAFLLISLTLVGAVQAGEDWDVSNMPGEKREVLLDTDEGTWMSLDVSPDGRTIAFDLLGDIYLLPIAGGTARVIADGPAWEMQPRFSPDGSMIAFSSDRGGAANLWVMKADGSERRAVTNEQFHTLNNPTWSADGKYLAGRKHYTTWRSLGSGEIWLYHLSGGEGIPLVRRRSETLQKELGEPIFSADGGSLYFTRNVTPGDLFVYAQDSNQQSFQIKRYDMETAQTEVAVAGNGGAVRAAPSPDGKSIAFVRRMRERSALFLKDLASGELSLLYDGLNRDMQETWAIEGLYPNMDWTPDSRSILFWAGGKIRRLDIADRKLSDIPFRVRQPHLLTEPPGFPVEVAPDTFDTRMIRWPVVSPDGKRVVFESSGRLYLKTLPDGKPKLLTRDGADRFELFPAWSRDGKSIVFVGWTDRELGSVRKVSARGGRSKVLSREPGYYRRPGFSPDGALIVVEKVSGSSLTANRFSDNTGIFVLPAQGGALRRVTRDGRDPHFGSGNGRIFVTRTKNASALPGARNVGGEEHLVSIDLNGEAERSWAFSDRATRLLIAPAQDWLAWRENYHIYVMPMPPVPAAIKVGVAERDGGDPNKALPTRRVSIDGGQFPAWSGTGRLSWSMGPGLYQQSLPIAEGPAIADLSREVRADRPEGTLALVGGRVITMNPQRRVIRDATLLVRDNRIVGVGERERLPVPAGAIEVDVSGKTLIPGIIDAHAHASQGSGELVPQQNWQNLAALALGVTTIHDPSNAAAQVYAAAEMQRAGIILAPRIYSTGEIIYGARSEYYAVIDSLEDARRHVRRLKAQGAISVKNYNQPRREQRQQVNVAAREEGLMVVAEGGSLFHMDMTLITDGVTGVEHNLPVAPLYDDVMQLWTATPVGYTLTLNVNYGGLSGEVYWYQQDDVWLHPLLSRYVPPRVLQPRALRRTKAPDTEYRQLRDSAATGAALARAGIDVNIGGHGQREGLGAHWEMWSFALGGMTPMEALETGTLAPARYLGMERDLGSIEVGKLADLVILDANPLEDIRNSDTVDRVMLNGRLYQAATMNEMVTGNRKLADLYWWSEPQAQLLKR